MARLPMNPRIYALFGQGRSQCIPSALWHSNVVEKGRDIDEIRFRYDHAWDVTQSLVVIAPGVAPARADAIHFSQLRQPDRGMEIRHVIAKTDFTHVVRPSSRISIHHFRGLSHAQQSHFVDARQFLLRANDEKTAVDTGDCLNW